MSPLSGAAVTGWALACALLTLPGWRWLRSLGHRRDGEGEGSVAALWLPPVALLVGALVALTHGPRPLLCGVYVACAAVLLVLAAIDIDVQRLPNVLTAPLLALAAAGLTAVALVDGDWAAWRRGLWGALALGAAYLVLVLAGRGTGMGMGDLKLSPSIGMLLAHQSWDTLVAGTVLTFVVGGLGALWLLVARRANRSTHLAFGPAMVTGTILATVAPGLAGLT